MVEADEGPRADTSLEKLARLRPAFRDGRHRDRRQRLDAQRRRRLPGARRRAQRAEALGADPLARVVSIGVAGVDPAYMGIGPVPAIRRALDAAGLTLDDIDLIEINEAFAAQVLACAGELGIEEERLNVNGGAIALGHPLGCSGARLLTTLVWEMRRRGARRGVAALCVGVGQGVATMVENPEASLSGARGSGIASGRWRRPSSRASTGRSRRRPRRPSRCPTTGSTGATGCSR